MTFAEKLALEKKRKAFSEVLAKDNPGLITGEDKGGLTQPILGKSERDGAAPFGTSFNVAQQHKADELFDNDEKVKQKAISDAQLLYMLRGGGDEFRTALTIADTKRSKNKESGDTSGIYHNTISDIYKESYFSELQKAPTLENYKKFIDAQGRSPYASGSYKGNDALAVATSIMYSGNKDFKYEDDAFAKKLFGEEENRILTMERERDSKVKAQKESTSLYENLKDTQDDIADMAVQFGAFAGFREQADKATDRIKERSIKNNEEKKEKEKRGAEISALGDEIAYRKANLEFQKQYYQLSKAKDFNEYNHNIPGKNIAVYHPQVKASLDTMFDMAEYDENGVNFLGLTKEQVELFYYIGNTQGSKAAQKYIDTLLPLTAPESAKYRYNMVKDIPVIKQIDGTFQNLAGGLGGAIEGLINAGTSAVWKTFEFKVDPMTAAQPYIENAKGAEKVLYGVAQGTGQMLPTIGASFINPGLGKAVFGTSVYGNSYKEARKKGYSQSASFGYGMANAGLELTLENLGGFTVGGGKGKISYGGRLASKLDDVFKASPKMRAMAAIGGKAAVDYASEFSEEYLAEVFGPALSNFFLGENNEIKLYSDAHLEAGIIGGFTGLLLQSPSYVQSVARTFKKGSYGAESAFYINAASSVLEGEMYKGNPKAFEGMDKKQKSKAIKGYRKEKLYEAAYTAIFGHISQGVLEGRSLGTIMSDISAEGIDISEFEGDIRNAYSVALASNGADARLDRAIEEGLASGKTFYSIIGSVTADKSIISQIPQFSGLEGEALKGAIRQRIYEVKKNSPFLNEARALISQGEPTAYIIDSLISRGGRYVLPFTVDGAIDMAKAESLISGIRNSVIADEVNKRGLTGLDANHYIREAILRDRAADRVYSLARDGFSYEEARVTEGALASLLTDEQFSNVFARGQSVYNVEKKQKDAERAAQLSEAPIEDVDNDKGDTLDDSSIVLEKDFDEYSEEKQKIIEEYENYSHTGIREFVRDVLAGENTEKSLALNPVKEEAANLINKVTGIDVAGFKTSLEDRMVIHINDRHGKNGSADQSMANPADMERIQYVLENFDDIVLSGSSSAYTTIKKNGFPANAKAVTYSKAINGTFYVVEAVPNTKAKTLQVVSAYIETKKDAVSSRNAQGQAETSETPSDKHPSVDSISLSEKDVKSILDGVGSYGKTVYNRIVDEAVKKAVGGGESVTAAKKGVLEAFAHIYKAGTDGKAISKKYVDTYFSRSQVNEIYDAGKRDAESRSNVARKKNARLIKDEALRKAKLSSREVKMLEALAKICGRDIRFSEELHGNAKINLNTGEIVISTEAKNGIRWAAVHEVFHALRIDNPAEANRLIRVVCDILEKNKGLFNAVKAKYKDTYLSDLLDSDGYFKENFIDIIEEEIAADMIGYVISNSEALAKITGEQRNVLQRFIDRLESLFARKSGYLDKLSPEMRRAFYDVYREADAIAEQFKAAIEKQSEVVKEKGVEVERDEKKTSGEEVKKSRDLTSTDFVKDKYFDRKINKWNDLNENYISVGTVKRNSVLNKIGVPTGKVYYDVSKIKKGFADHKDHLNSDILKRVPDILNHPIVITEYKPGQSSNTISIYGNLIINNKPIVVGLVVKAGNGNNIISKIRSVHMQSDLKSQITNESILYLSENKKETNAWFNSYAGIDVPEVGTQLGIIRSIDFNNNIPQKEDIVNSILLQNDVKHSRDLSEDISEREEKNLDLSDNDLSDYIKTGKTLHTRNKKQRMLESGKKPILTSYVEFKEFISNVISGKAPGEVRAFKKVGRRLAEAIQNKKNSINMLGKYLELNADDLRESYKKHLEPKEIGDIPLSEQDFERIPEYLDEFDDVLSVNTYNNKIEIHLYKETEEGYIRILTVVSSERNSLQITKLIGVSKEKFEKKYAKKIEGNIGSLWSKTKNSIPSTTAQLTADVPSNTSIYHSSEKSNGEIVNNEKKQYSEKNNEKHSRDLTELTLAKRKEETIKKTVSHLRGMSRSKYSKADIEARLTDIYDDMDNLSGEEADVIISEKISRLCDSILSDVSKKKIIDHRAKEVLSEIRQKSISFDKAQQAAAKSAYGNNYHRVFFGKVRLAKTGTNLDEQWQKWAESYPEYFDNDTNSADMPLVLLETIDSLKRQAITFEEYDTEAIKKALTAEITHSFKKVEKYESLRKSAIRAALQLQHKNEAALERWGLRLGERVVKPISLDEVIKKIKDSFDVGIAVGGDASVEGSNTFDAIYKKKQGIIRTKFQNDLPAIVEGLALYLDDRFKLLDAVLERTEKVRKEAGGVENTRCLIEQELLKYTKGNAQAGNRIKNGLFKFIRQYFVSKETAFDAAPELYRFFEETISKDKETMDAIKECSEIVSLYFKQSYMERASSAIMTKEEWKKLNAPSFSERLTGTKEKLIEWIIDKFYGIKAAEKYHGVFDLSSSESATVRANLSYLAADKANYILEKRFVDYDGNVVGKSLAEILAPISKGKDAKKKAELFGKYLVFRHAPEFIQAKANKHSEKIQRMLASGLEWESEEVQKEAAKKKKQLVFADQRIASPERATQLADEILQENPEFESLADDIYEFMDNVVEYYLIPSGVLSRKAAEAYKELFPCYVPLYRFIDKGNSRSKAFKSYFSNLQNPIKVSEGGGASIQNPIESILDYTIRAVDILYKNNVMRAIVKEFDGVPGVIDRVYSKSQLEQIRVDESPFEFFGEVYERRDEEPGESKSSFSLVASGSKNTVFLWEDGQKVFYQIFDDRLYRAVANLEEKQVKGLLKIAKWISNIQKPFYTVKSLTYGLRNMYRDFWTFEQNSDPNMWFGQMIKLYGKAIVSQIVNSEDYRLYKALGGKSGTMRGSRVEAISKAAKLNYKADKDGLSRVISKVLTPGVIGNLNEMIETAPRLAEFMYVKQKTEDVHLAIYKAMDITTNFKRTGTVYPLANSIFLFANAQMQGTDRMIRQYSEAGYTNGKEFDGKQLAKVIAHTTVTAIIKAAIFAFLNHRDEESEKEYSRLSSFIKNNYDVIVIPGGKNIKLPKERELSIPRTLMQMVIDSAFGDKQELLDVGGYLFDMLAPSYLPWIGDIITEGPTAAIHPALNNTVLGPVFDVAFNRDYKGDTIVPTYFEDDAANHTKYTRYTSAFSVWLAKALYDVAGTDISPMAIDHYLSSGGYIADTVIGLMPNEKVSEDGLFKTVIDMVRPDEDSVGAIGQVLSSASNIFGGVLGFERSFTVDSAYSNDILDGFYEEQRKAKVLADRLDADGTTKAKSEKYTVFKSFISEYNKLSNGSNEKQQRNYRIALLETIGEFGGNELTPGQKYAADIYDKTSYPSVFVSSYPKSQWEKDFSDGSKRYSCKVALDIFQYTQFVNDIESMRENFRIYVMNLGLKPMEAAELLKSGYSKIDTTVKKDYEERYGVTSDITIEYKDEKERKSERSDILDTALEYLIQNS